LALALIGETAQGIMLVCPNLTPRAGAFFYLLNITVLLFCRRSCCRRFHFLHVYTAHGTFTGLAAAHITVRAIVITNFYQGNLVLWAFACFSRCVSAGRAAICYCWCRSFLSRCFACALCACTKTKKTYCYSQK